MGQALSEVGLSILVILIVETGLMTLVLMTVKIRVVWEVALFATVALWMDYFMEFTFFSTVLSIDLQRLEVSSPCPSHTQFIHFTFEVVWAFTERESICPFPACRPLETRIRSTETEAERQQGHSWPSVQEVNRTVRKDLLQFQKRHQRQKGPFHFRTFGELGHFPPHCGKAHN